VDALVTLGAAVSFGLLATVHLALVRALWRTPPRWRSLVGLALPPVGLLFAIQAGFRYRAALWTLCLVLYLGMLIAAR